MDLWALNIVKMRKGMMKWNLHSKQIMNYTRSLRPNQHLPTWYVSSFNVTVLKHLCRTQTTKQSWTACTTTRLPARSSTSNFFSDVHTDDIKYYPQYFTDSISLQLISFVLTVVHGISFFHADRLTIEPGWTSIRWVAYRPIWKGGIQREEVWESVQPSFRWPLPLEGLLSYLTF